METQRRKCRFSAILEKEFPMFKKTKYNNEVTCTTCTVDINIANKGKHDLEQHIKSQKHKKNIGSAVSSKKIDSVFESQSLCEIEKISATEATLAYHTVKHHMSYRSTDCTHKLLAKLFNDSKIAAKISMARTKTEAIVNKVLAPYSIEVLNYCFFVCQNQLNN